MVIFAGPFGRHWGSPRERFREGHPLVGEVGGYEEKQVMEFLKNNPYSDELSYRESCLFDLECEGGGD